MNIHEYQAKELLKEYNVPTVPGFLALDSESAVGAAKEIGGDVWVVKAQIHAGGRGKGGGVKVVKSLEEVKSISEEILGPEITPIFFSSMLVFSTRRHAKISSIDFTYD
jgi:succinyl-CoA synthetase beta subunit